MNNYTELRGECQETYYNMGRALHQLGKIIVYKHVKLYVTIVKWKYTLGVAKTRYRKCALLHSVFTVPETLPFFRSSTVRSLFTLLRSQIVPRSLTIQSLRCHSEYQNGRINLHSKAKMIKERVRIYKNGRKLSY